MRLTIICLMLVAIPCTLVAKESLYQSCTKNVKTNPSEALRIADQWIQEQNHPSAFHCRALALFALKRYPEAAKALELLSQRVTQKNLILWGNVLRQAAKSWELAEDKAKAIVVLTKGIQQTANLGLNQPIVGQLSAELLLDRSQLYASGGRELFAIQDLDQALSLAPDNPKLLFARAELFARQKEKTLAKRDLDALANINPNYPGAAQLKKALR